MKRQKVIRELIRFEFYVLNMNLVGPKISKHISMWTKGALQTTCDETLWVGLVEPTKEQAWSQIRELLQ